jgi:hypothetical protein
MEYQYKLLIGILHFKNEEVNWNWILEKHMTLTK